MWKNRLDKFSRVVLSHLEGNADRRTRWMLATSMPRSRKNHQQSPVTPCDRGWLHILISKRAEPNACHTSGSKMIISPLLGPVSCRLTRVLLCASIKDQWKLFKCVSSRKRKRIPRSCLATRALLRKIFS